MFCLRGSYSLILMKVPVVDPMSVMKKFPSLKVISACFLEILSSRMRIWELECLPIRPPDSSIQKKLVCGPSLGWMMSSLDCFS